MGWQRAVYSLVLVSRPESSEYSERKLNHDGVVFYFSMWYRRQERQFRVALFFSSAAFSGAFGGILAFGIAHMNGVGGLHGWRW